MRSRLVMSATAGVLAFGLGGCGGSDDSSEATSPSVTAQVEEICAKRGLSTENGAEFPVQDFDPGSPRPADLPAVGEYFAAGLNEQPAAIAALEDLDATGDEGERVAALIRAFEAEYAGVKAQVEAALASDVASSRPWTTRLP
jgi:hypothetical protein